jgi:hypothetical protein
MFPRTASQKQHQTKKGDDGHGYQADLHISIHFLSSKAFICHSFSQV